MSNIKYLAKYNGPSYASYDLGKMESFNSFYEAKCEMHRRQSMGYGYTTTYRQNEDGLYVLWESEGRYDFPGTTTEDTMDLYSVTAAEGAYRCQPEPFIRLFVGPRGGIRLENY